MPRRLAACISMLPSGTSIFLPSTSTSTIACLAFRLPCLPSDVRRHDAGLVFDVVRELVAIVLEEGAHRHRRGIPQGADGASLDVVGEPVELVQVLRAALAVLDPVDDAVEPAGAL